MLYSGNGSNGNGIVGGIFTRTASVIVTNSGVNVVSATTPLEAWNYSGAQLLAPVGTPAVFADGQIVLSSNVVKRGAVQMSLQTSFAGGTIFYSLDGSDPRSNPTLYTGPFMAGNSGLLRAVAYNSSFSASVEMDGVQVTILPSLTVNTAGGGTVSVAPPSGPYFSNSVAQLTAEPASGCTFLQWLGDASGVNPITTITMTRNKYVEAIFGTPVGIATIGAGSVLADPSVPLYPFGTTVKFTALPQSGNYLAFWGGAGTDNPLNLVVSAPNPSVTAVFMPLEVDQFALTVIENGKGHVTVNPYENYYTNGQPVSLTAVPDAGQDFINWSGDATGTQNPLLVGMTQSRVISANFTTRPKLRVGTPLEGLVEDGFRLTLTGEFGAQYQILGSTNLLDWTHAGTVTNTYGTSQLTDSAATNSPFRFYRAELVQP